MIHEATKVLISPHFYTFETQTQVWDVTLQPSALPQIQILLCKNVLKAFVISKDITRFTIKIVSPKLQSEHYCGQL